MKNNIDTPQDVEIKKSQEQQLAEQQQMFEKISINLQLNLNDVNILMAALDELPHKFSRRTYDKIKSQAQTQLPADPTKI